MQFPTGGKVRERKLNRCDSGTDSTVWMEEDFCAVTRAIWTVCLQHLKFVSGAYFVCKGWSSMKTLFSSISENVQFVLLCLAVTAAVVLLAWVGEKLVMKKRHRLSTAHTITTVGMLAAISGVLMVIELPLFFAPPFYKLDFSELPVLICAFSLGPVAGVVCEFLKVLIHLLLKGTSTAFVGDLALSLIHISEPTRP